MRDQRTVGRSPYCRDDGSAGATTAHSGAADSATAESTIAESATARAATARAATAESTTARATAAVAAARGDRGNRERGERVDDDRIQSESGHCSDGSDDHLGEQRSRVAYLDVECGRLELRHSSGRQLREDLSVGRHVSVPLCDPPKHGRNGSRALATSFDFPRGSSSAHRRSATADCSRNSEKR